MVVAPLLAAMLAGAALTGMVVWRLNLKTVEGQIKAKRAALKKLSLSGNIPPNQEVMEYLSARQTSIERRYQDWISRVAAPVAEAAVADPQLHFQERFHEVQQTLERLATARTLATPELLGFPKEIPPADTVPRLLVQLALIQEAATTMLEQGASAVASLKLEDPESAQAAGGAFLVRLPVQARLSCSLPQLMKMFAAFERATPLIDVHAIRLAGTAPGETLDVELSLARYLIAAPAVSSAADIEEAEKSAGPAPNARQPKPSSKKHKAE